MTKRRHPEADLQRAVAQYLDTVLKPPAFWFHVPNGERRDARTGAMLKAMGVKPGVADCLLFYETEDGDGCLFLNVLAIELKVGKGKPSEAQKDFRKKLEKVGGNYIICTSIRDVSDALVAFSVPTKGRIAA